MQRSMYAPVQAPILSQSLETLPVVQTIVHPPTYLPPIVHEPIVRTSIVHAPIIQPAPIIQEPLILEEHRERTVTEEFIPAPQPAPMIRSTLMETRPPWFGRTLLIRPVAAQLTHNTDFFLFRMDPFVELIVGPHRYKTTIHKNGGKRPQWNETFSHPLVTPDSEMSIVVWDQDRRKADLVGEARINLGQVFAHGSSSNWYELFWRGKSAGRILINMEIV